ncbi:hypothetical protein AN219_22185 [Streptomyces nanshensis]|nr:hypothetical protein AN219_22185 [Streptomyces nanshensis]
MPTVRRVALLLPLMLITAGAALDLVTERGLPGSPLFTVAPLVAAPFTSTLVTALTGLASAGVLAVVLLMDEVTWSEDDLTRIVTVVMVGLLAVAINRLLHRMNAALTSARTIAQVAQLAVLPVPPSRIGDLQIAARYEAAQSGAHIGGDLYAVHEVPQGVRLIVGDVRGKGLQAVRTMAVVVGTFREAVEQEATLEGVARRLDRAVLREKLGRKGTDAYEDFTTAVIAEVPVEDAGVLRLVNRAHPAPLLFLPDGRAGLIDPAEPALPLGVSELGEWPDRAEEIPFPPGMQILFYTDGLSEARDRAGSFYEPGVRLSGRAFSGPEALLDEVLEDVARHARGDIKDDLALVAVQRGTGPD